MRIIPGDPQATRPWVVTAGSLPLKVKLSLTSRRVRAGSPLVPTPSGWAACSGDEPAWAFSADYKMPGDETTAWREIVVDMGQVLGVPGTRFRIADADDAGGLTFELDPDGPHAVLWDTYVLLTCQHKHSLPPAVPPLPPEAVVEGVPDYQNHPDLDPPVSDGPVAASERPVRGVVRER